MGSPILLVVEDSEADTQVLKRVFMGEPYSVEYAASGEAALELLTGGLRPDLVMLDIGLPGLTARELLDHLRKTHVGTRVLALSGEVTVPLLRQFMNRGILDFLSKDDYLATRQGRGLLLLEVKKALLVSPASFPGRSIDDVQTIDSLLDRIRRLEKKLEETRTEARNALEEEKRIREQERSRYERHLNVQMRLRDVEKDVIMRRTALMTRSSLEADKAAARAAAWWRQVIGYGIGVAGIAGLHFANIVTEAWVLAAILVSSIVLLGIRLDAVRELSLGVGRRFRLALRIGKREGIDKGDSPDSPDDQAAS